LANQGSGSPGNSSDLAMLLLRRCFRPGMKGTREDWIMSVSPGPQVHTGMWAWLKEEQDTGTRVIRAGATSASH
jgi:hypothetical protein